MATKYVYTSEAGAGKNGVRKVSGIEGEFEYQRPSSAAGCVVFLMLMASFAAAGYFMFFM